MDPVLEEDKQVYNLQQLLESIFGPMDIDKLAELDNLTKDEAPTQPKDTAELSGQQQYVLHTS
jgi:hypothetical protein